MSEIYSQWWFWMAIIGIIFVIIALIVYAVEKKFEWYTWALLIFGIILLIIGLIGAFTSGDKPSDEEMFAAATAQLMATDQCGNPTTMQVPVQAQMQVSRPVTVSQQQYAVQRSVPVQMSPPVQQYVVSSPVRSVPSTRSSPIINYDLPVARSATPSRSPSIYSPSSYSPSSYSPYSSSPGLQSTRSSFGSNGGNIVTITPGSGVTSPIIRPGY